MDPTMIAFLGCLGMLMLILLGVHVAFSLAAVGLLGLSALLGPDLAVRFLAPSAFSTAAQYTWAVFPLFIIMGNLAAISGITTEAFEAAKKWLGRLPGGLAMATCVASGVFSACSGSTVANAAVFTPLALPQMTNNGYDKRLSVGAIAAAGTFAAMIPPSIGMVIYGIITGEPIGKLFMAGVIPGVLTLVIYLIGIYLRVRRNPSLAPVMPITASWTEKFTSLQGTWPIMAIFLLIMAGIYGGWFAPSAAGAVGAFATLLLIIVRKRLSYPGLKSVLWDAVTITSTLFLILIGGIIFGKFLTVTGFAAYVSGTVGGLDLPPLAIVCLLMLVYLVLGCFLDPPSTMVITLPVVYPLIQNLGLNGIWFGVILTKVIEIALITPPVGLNVYVVNSAAGEQTELEDVFAGILPFFVLEVISLILLILFPQISLWLPSMMN